MSMNYWIFTDGDGGAFLYQTTTLNADIADVGATYLWGTLWLKYAGQAITYDVGLCTHKFTGQDEIDGETT